MPNKGRNMLVTLLGYTWECMVVSIAMPKSHIIWNVGDNLRLCLRSAMLITLNMMNWPEGDFDLLS